MRPTSYLCVLCAIALVSLGPSRSAGAAAPEKSPTVVSPEGASPAEVLAAKEVRRYLYVRTGKLLPLVVNAAKAPTDDFVIVATKDRPLLKGLVSDAATKAALDGLKPQQYLLKTIRVKGQPVILVAGGDPAGALYGAYRFAERLGVRFYLHGDVIPDGRMTRNVQDLDEVGKPLFDTRGIQPFHDFPEGPDWWNTDDYKAIISQLPKMRMNFLGLHTYPEGGPNAEPTVWIGPPSEIGDGTLVKAGYPSSYQNTLRGNWGYQAKKTGDFIFGAAELFERDAFGADVMTDACPQPTKPEACNDLFDRTGRMLADAFRHAHTLGVKTCVGTETPLTIPGQVRERLKAAGKDAKDPAVVREVYEGIFRRIMAAYPLDYYWFWTPEGWTWGSTNEAQVKATVADLEAALAAAKKAGAPFTLATCGWVLGPQNDRALFDKMLPKDMPMSCINRQVGEEPVERGFAKVEGRPKWAIPWMEDDPRLTSPQLWAGRMRKDAADALKYGCTGLLGIHWRTRVLAPNVSALARAAWDQRGWSKPEAAPAAPAWTEGPEGGNMAPFPSNPIADTAEPTIYQTVRYGLAAYHLKVPNGTYAVTLKFSEPHYKEKGRRVFGVKLQDKTVIDTLDIFEKVGQNKALDYTFKDIEVKDGWMHVEFVPQVEFPSIAGIVLQGKDSARKINCGGPAWQDYQADWPVQGGAAPGKDRFAPCGDFYRDWAAAEFGREAAARIAALFEKVDGYLPRPCDWTDGPGGLKPDARPWAEVAKAYDFVDELAALRPDVKGAGNLDRFDYWLHTFQYMRAMARVDCAWAEYNKAHDKVKAEKDAEKKKALAKETALPPRRELVKAVGEVYEHLLALVSNPGELGTVANWEQHILPHVLVNPGKELAAALGEPLPADADPPRAYAGPTRVIVPTLRTAIASGEPLALKVIILAAKPPKDAAACWRPLDKTEFTKVPLVHVARGVYSARITPADGADFEYYVEATPDSGDAVRFPATAPAVNQTVVVMPVGR